MESIIFPMSESWDPAKQIVSFPAIKEGDVVVCKVPFSTMQAIFGASPEDVLDAFLTHRRLIESRAAFVAKTGRFELDGSVKITTDDFVYGYKI